MFLKPPGMKLGVAFQTNLPLAKYGPLAAQVEGYGFDSLTVFNDMLFQPCWLPLMEIARHTRRLHFGPIAVNPFTCHPVHLACQAALVSEEAKGRFYLGLARGAWLEYAGLKPARPIASLREAYACIRHLLNGNKDPLQGEIFPLLGGEKLQWPINYPDIPFYLATWGLKTMQGNIEHISAVKLGGTANPAVVKWLRQGIDEAARAAGRDPAQIEVIVGAASVVDEDGATARDLARKEAAHYLPIIAELDPSLRIDPEVIAGIREAAGRFDYAQAATFISDDLLRCFAFAGTPDQVISHVQELFEAGAGRVEFAPPHGKAPESGLHLLGTKVLPGLLSQKR